MAESEAKDWVLVWVEDLQSCNFANQCKFSTHTNTQSFASDSAIGFHLLQNPTCAQHYDDSRFSILAQGMYILN